MNWLRTAGKELFSLFVDDVPYSLAIVAWILVGTLVLPSLVVGAKTQAVVLFFGFAVILLLSVLITARQHRTP